MEPHERIRYTFYTLLRKLLISIGHNYLHKNGFKPNLYTFFYYGLMTLNFISCIYTLIWYDVFTSLNSVAYGAVVVQLTAKILIMRYASILTKTMNKIVGIYDENARTKSPKRAFFLQKVSWMSEWILIGGFVVYMFTAVLHFINPIYGYFWQHEFKALFPLYIPVIDEKTANGFAILISIQSFEVFAALVASACADFPFMILVLNVWIFSTNFGDNANELNEILRAKKVDMPSAKTKLQNIVEVYYDTWVLIDDINAIFFMSNFIVIFFAAVAAAVELFCCMKIGLIPAICLAGLFLFQIIGSCAFGTIIELCNNQMTDSLIYCDWYLLPLDDQKKFKFLVMHVDMGKTLTLGGILPLNMDTCVSILRKIYSCVMILHRIIE